MGGSNKLKDIFKTLRIRLMNLLPIRDLEDGDRKFPQVIIPFQHGNHIIFYINSDRHIDIIGILHGKMDIDKKSNVRGKTTCRRGTIYRGTTRRTIPVIEHFFEMDMGPTRNRSDTLGIFMAYDFIFFSEF